MFPPIVHKGSSFSTLSTPIVFCYYNNEHIKNYFWMRWVFAAETQLSLVVVTGGSSLLVALRLLIVVASLVAEHRL